MRLNSALCGIALISCISVLAGCGGGSGSGTPTQPVTPTPTGPASGSEFLYSFYSASDIQVAPINPTTGVIGSTADATSGLFPAPENAAAAQYGSFVYVVGFDQTGGGTDVWIFAITGANGELTAVNNSPYGFAGGGGTTHSYDLLIDTKHGRLYTSETSLDASDNTVFRLNPYTIDANNGTLKNENGFAEKGYQGTFLAPIIDPLGRYIYEIAISPVGWQIFVYAIDATTGEVSEASGSPFLVVPAASSQDYLDAQLFASPSGNFLYASLRGGSSGINNTYALSVDSATGALTSVPGSPFPNSDDLGTPIVMAPSGDFLYAQSDQQVRTGGVIYGIQTFALDPVHGTIATTPSSTFTYTGTFFGDSLIDPSGDVLISTGQFSDNPTVYSFAIKGTTGALTQASGSPFTLPDYASPPSISYESSLVVKIP